MYLISTVVQTVLRSMRKCGKCHHLQYVPGGKRAGAVDCKKCGAVIPARVK